MVSNLVVEIAIYNFGLYHSALLHICKEAGGPDSMKCTHMIPRDRDHFGFSQYNLLKKHTLNPESTLFVSISCSKALFKVPKICNINFWIENDPPPFGTFPKNHPIW